MKLVDILARELKVWPHSGNALGQAADRTLHLNEYASHGGEFYGWTKEKFTRAEDHHEAFVTRAQWQSAVDALKAEKAVEWNGEGLPPVGTVCKMQNAIGVWREVEIFAHFKGNVFGWDGGELVSYFSDKLDDFQRIKTPEQIAAEVRAKTIKQMVEDMRVMIGLAEFPDEKKAGRLYDLGYRKFEIVDK